MIVQVDVARVGGITPWLKVARLAEAYNVAIAPLFLMELHVSLACATPAGTYVEYIPQLDAVATSRLEVKDGHAYPPEVPGLGIDWDWREIRRARALSALSVSLLSKQNRVLVEAGGYGVSDAWIERLFSIIVVSWQHDVRFGDG